MRKVLFVLLVLGLVGISAAVAQYKPMLTTNGVKLFDIDDFDTGGGAFLFYNSEIVTAHISGGTIWLRRHDEDYNLIGSPAVVTSATTVAGIALGETSGGNVAVFWVDYTDGSSYEYYARMYNSSLTPLFSAVLISSESDRAQEPTLTADDSGGVFILYGNRDIDTLQIAHIDANGGIWNTPLNLRVHDRDVGWDAVLGLSGQLLVVSVSSESDTDDYAFGVYADLVEDQGTSGRIVASTRLRSGSQPIVKKNGNYFYVACHEVSQALVGSIYLFKLNASNLAVDQTYGSSGKQIPHVFSEFGPYVTFDEDGYVYISWTDLREGNYWSDVYVSKLDPANGNPIWTKNVTNAEGVQTTLFGPAYSKSPLLYDETADKLFLTWHDYRLASAAYNWATTLGIGSPATDIFMQEIDPSDGSTLADPIVVTSRHFQEIIPMFSNPSSLWIGWLTIATTPELAAYISAQRIDSIAAQINSVNTTTGNTQIKIYGQGFGSDPTNYYNPDFALYSDHNNVKADGLTIEVTAWTTNEITATCSVPAGTSKELVVTAYGDVSNAWTLTSTGLIYFGDAYFDQTKYSALFPSRIFITDDSTLEVEVSGNEPVTATLEVRVNGATQSRTDVMSYFSSDKFSIPLTGLNLSAGDIDCILVVYDAYGNYAAETYLAQISASTSGQATNMVVQGTTVAFNFAPPFGASPGVDHTVRLLIIGPSGSPVSVTRGVTIGYNEIMLDDPNYFPSNGLYIVKAYYGNTYLGKVAISILR